MRRTNYIRKKKRLKWLRTVGFSFITICFALLTMFGGMFIYAQMAGAPSLNVSKASVFLDADGHEIGDMIGNEKRYWVNLDDISPFIQEAFVATEDQQFYDHHGFNYKRIASALFKDIKNRSKVEGASTISQQYARNLYLSPTKTWKRKFEEALITFRLERFYDKDTILEGYLNTIYFGHGMYGVEAAADFYFGKSAKDVTLEEAAVITAIAKGPSIYSPINDYERSMERKDLVLSRMKEQQFITPEQYERSKDIHIVVRERNEETDSVAPYFLDAAWKEAEALLTKQGRFIEGGGWTIRTTLNTTHQEIAERAIENGLPETELEVGFISMMPDSGAITALVGGKNYASSAFNRVTQAKRQPGSAMKPIVYAAALENGFSPLTYLLPEQTVFTFDEGRETYEPKNINGEFADHPISLAQALAISDNVYAVKTLEEIGFDPFEKMMDRLHIRTKTPTTLSSALGTAEVSLQDMTGAYNVFAANGQDHLPHTILSIQDRNGKTVYERKTEDKQLLDEKDAFVLSHLMTGMFDPVFNDYLPVTGMSLRQQQTRPYAAKSGTTLSDQYLIGYTPSLTAGIWNGYDDGRKIEVTIDQAVTKKIWIDFMESVHSGVTPEAFIPPEGVESAVIDIETGGLAVGECQKQRVMYLKEQDLPNKLCTDRSLQQRKTADDDKKFNLFPFSFFD